jgi:hypothetical protein
MEIGSAYMRSWLLRSSVAYVLYYKRESAFAVCNVYVRESNPISPQQHASAICELYVLIFLQVSVNEL